MSNEAERSRIAECACGQARLEARGEPSVVSVCNCHACKRRTGSAFGVVAFYPRDKVRPPNTGMRMFERTSDAGRSLRMHFCEGCGTTIYWEAEFRPTEYGVAVGCFADPDFPPPGRAVWCASKLKWLKFPADWQQFPGAPG